MKVKKTEEDIANYRLEKINKIKKKPAKKGFYRLFEEKQDKNINSSNLADGSMSSKIFNKSVNKKNVTLRMLDFEHDATNPNLEDKGPKFFMRVKYLSYVVYIISFLIYKQSLFNCGNVSMNECIEKYDLNILIESFIKCVLSGFILSFNLAMIFWQILATTHLFGFIAFLFLLLMIDMGNDLYSHGLINFILLLITLIYGFLFYCTIKIVVESINNKNYKLLFLMIGVVILALGGFLTIYFLVVSCRYWDKGFGNKKIDNDLNKYGCKILKPNTCYMDMFGSLFDFSKMSKYNCDKNNNPLFNDIINDYVLYYDKEFNEETNVLNYPKTTLMNLYSEEDESSLDKKVINNIIGSEEKDYINSEVFLVRNNSRASIEMNINKNTSLESERKSLSYADAKIKNIIVLYFDSLSRAQFHRKLSDFSSFISDISDLTNNNYDSFEFFKYHTFGTEGFNPTSLSMFFGKNILSPEKNVHMISHLKNNGYITAQSANICSQNLNKNINYNIINDKFDYENIAMFCDPLYNLANTKNYNIKGINSSIKRCLYGKNSYEYVLNYGKIFWNTYPDNNKFLLLGFFDGSEKSGQVVKYMDNSLSDFLLNLINKKQFHKTALFIVSSTGELKMGVFNKIDSEYFYEKNLGSFFIVLHRAGMKQDIIDNLKSNQQSFVTAYDIYDSILSIAYNCFEDECWKNIKNISKNGKSVFGVIDSKKRNCYNYFSEIKQNECFCFN